MSLQLYKEIEICPKATKVIRFDKAESSTVAYGMLVSLCGLTLDHVIDFIESDGDLIQSDVCFFSNASNHSAVVLSHCQIEIYQRAELT